MFVSRHTVAASGLNVAWRGQPFQCSTKLLSLMFKSPLKNRANSYADMALRCQQARAFYSHSTFLNVYILFDIIQGMDKSAAKPGTFFGSLLKDLRHFSQGAKRECGYQVDNVQRGEETDDWKPMSTGDEGVREMHVRDAAPARSG